MKLDLNLTAYTKKLQMDHRFNVKNWSLILKDIIEELCICKYYICEHLYMKNKTSVSKGKDW